MLEKFKLETDYSKIRLFKWLFKWFRKWIKKYNLEKKYKKAKDFFEKDPFSPSLNTEILEPKNRLIYSFRLDIKYRAIFIKRKR